MDEVVIKDDWLALQIRNELVKNNNRDSKYKWNEYHKFTISELETIKSLDLNGKITDISELKYCVNLENLNISSSSLYLMKSIINYVKKML